RRYTCPTVTRDRVVGVRKKAETQQMWQGKNTAQNAAGSQEAAENEFYSRLGAQSPLANPQPPATPPGAQNVALLNFNPNREEWLLSPQQLQTWGNAFGTVSLPDVPGKPVLIVPREAPSAEVEVTMSPLVGVWLPSTGREDRLVALRMVRVEGKEVC